MLVRLLILVLIVMLNGCTSQVSKPQKNQNYSSVPFNSFQKAILFDVELSDSCSINSINESIRQKINDRLQVSLNELFDSAFTNSNGSDNTLLIKPIISEIQYVSRGKRILFGSFAGSSAVLMRIGFINKEDGQTISQIEIYEDSGSVSGEITQGDADEWLIDRLVSKVSEYIIENL